ncbi:DUF2938 domain-containing protein [Sedimentitalea sp. CY04]|uniref:DUF2938 domain-containing protein n=1 Tax=Parasedimentitalea denitrificans TaxID=2211118 RepID=A0ABX0W733_9RHOB|nr:DUF2938 family protein [Sedimentitalea sp. CY04]NIZ61465.1 DUF2938 domain-containing protein [Sedimentitalea sp. CY04]
MSWSLEIMLKVVVIGIGATVILDMFALLRAKLTGQPMMNWAMVGRWVGHFTMGTPVLRYPAEAAAIPGEKALGWGFHYVIGIGLAATLTQLVGPTWIEQPRLDWAVGFGAVTVILPWFFMQPGLGLGIAARLAPAPWKVRRQSLTTHVVFGVGLYLSAVTLQSVF